MMPKRETVADIVAALRKCSDEWTGDGSMINMECVGSFASCLADRIEAAWKQERDECRMLAATTIVTEKVPVGNAAATYEALEKVRFYLSYMVQDVRLNRENVNTGGYYDKIRGIIEAALSAPPRNCDVGTPEEQAERFAKHCDRFHRCTGCPCCGKVKYNRCEFFWAQMPYEAKEGDAK